MYYVFKNKDFILCNYADYIMRNAGLEEAQAGIKISRRNIITSDMQMTPPLCLVDELKPAQKSATF